MLHTDSALLRREPGAQNTQRNDGCFHLLGIATRCTPNPSMRDPKNAKMDATTHFSWAAWAIT